MNKIDLQLEFQQLQKLTKKLLKRMEEFQHHLEKYTNTPQKDEPKVPNKTISVPTVFPVTGPNVPTKPYNTCAKCGVQLNGVVPYPCPFANCPSGLGSPWINTDKVVD